MSARKIKTKTENPASSKDYLKKASDNHAQMLSALGNVNFNAASTLAVQCAISSADAICVHELGIRSVSQDHRDVCDLVKSIPLKEASNKSNSLKRIIAKKHLIQYESRSITQTEAEEIVKWASRFYIWVVSVIEK